MKLKLILALALSLFGQSTFAGNRLHLIEKNEQTGFAIYRTGKPNLADYKELCNLGVEEMIVLSGTAAKHELAFQSYCPQMKVIYNQKQNAKVALTETFLRQFDEWVLDAKARGKKIAFRCECGCHRTGRLAAYYQMKYQNMTVEDALALMNQYGHLMFLHRDLIPQVKALNQYIKGETCTQVDKACVKKEDSNFELAADQDAGE